MAEDEEGAQNLSLPKAWPKRQGWRDKETSHRPGSLKGDDICDGDHSLGIRDCGRKREEAGLDRGWSWTNSAKPWPDTWGALEWVLSGRELVPISNGQASLSHWVWPAPGRAWAQVRSGFCSWGRFWRSWHLGAAHRPHCPQLGGKLHGSHPCLPHRRARVDRKWMKAQ